MRLVYLTSSLPHGTGGESFLLPEIVALRRLGHQLLVIPAAPRGNIVHGRCRELEELFLVRGLVSRDIVIAAVLQLLRHPIRTLVALCRITSLRRPKQSLRNLALFPKGLWLGRVAAQWRADHIHAHWATAPASLAMVASRSSDVPWSMTAHRYDIRRNDLLASKFRHASFTRFISRSGLELARQIGVEPPARSLVLHMGVEVPSTDPVTKASASTDQTLLCVARLVPVKGHKVLLQALSMLVHRELHPTLLLAGDGILREELERRVEAAGLTNRVRFLGHLPQEEIFSLYRRRAIDATVLPSVVLEPGEHEGIPVSLMEAMANGVSVVATSTGGTPELICEGTGLLVPGGDGQALAHALERILTDDDLRYKLARAAWRRVSERFNVETTARELAKRFEAATA